MRVFYDPVSIFATVSSAFTAAQPFLAAGSALLTFASAAGQGAQQIVQGQQDLNDAEAQARDLELQALQSKKATNRDVRDLEKQRKRDLARTRAVLSAQGLSADNPNAIGLLADVNREAAVRERRLLEDEDVTQTTLGIRAENTRAAGRAARDQSVFGGAATVAGGAATLLRPRPTARATARA